VTATCIDWAAEYGHYRKLMVEPRSKPLFDAVLQYWNDRLFPSTSLAVTEPSPEPVREPEEPVQYSALEEFLAGTNLAQLPVVPAQQLLSSQIIQGDVGALEAVSSPLEVVVDANPVVHIYDLEADNAEGFNKIQSEHTKDDDNLQPPKKRQKTTARTLPQKPATRSRAGKARKARKVKK